MWLSISAQDSTLQRSICCEKHCDEVCVVLVLFLLLTCLLRTLVVPPRHNRVIPRYTVQRELFYFKPLDTQHSLHHKMLLTLHIETMEVQVDAAADDTLETLRDAVEAATTLTRTIIRFVDIASDTIIAGPAHCDSTPLAECVVGDAVRVEEIVVPTLCNASEEARSDRSVVMWHVAQFGSNLQFASEELCDDEEVVGVALGRCCGAFEFASERIQNDMAYARQAVSEDGDLLQHAGIELQDDLALVTVGLPFSFKYASERLRDDPILAKRVISENAQYYRYLSPRLKADITFAQIAVHSDERLLFSAPMEVRHDSRLLVSVVTKDPRLITFSAFEDAFEDLPCVLAFVSHPNPLSWPYLARIYDLISESLREDVLPKIAERHPQLRFERWDDMRQRLQLLAVGSRLEHESDEVKDDTALVTCLVQICGDNIQYASPRLRRDPVLCKLAVARNPANSVFTLSDDS